MYINEIASYVGNNQNAVKSFLNNIF